MHTTVYVDTVKLNRRPGGYQLVYQRCCRNVTINNIVRPLETGATYDIWLTEEAMSRCNNSPVFREWPPIFICANEPLSFDHSASDLDGDSLVYNLCMPFQGATFAEPKPQPPNPPPYDEVMLIEPTYSVDNFLGFGEPLAVDPEDGLMTVTPALLGQYVVGVCVDEFDKNTGELLSQTRRDFQYNVIECLPFNVQVDVPDAVCDNFTVQFENLTNDVDDFAWTLDDGAGNVVTSTDENPVFTFPDTGTFSVELIVEPNSLCESSFSKEVFVQINSIAPDFSVEVFACADSAYLFLQDESIDSVSFITEWEWMIMPDNGTPFTVTGENPVVAVPINSEGSIQLNVESNNTCLAMVTGRYSAMGQDVTTLLRDTVTSCAGDSVFLNDLVSLDSRFTYSWTGPGITNPNEVNPRVEATAGFTTYQLVLEAQNTTCVINHMVVVEGAQSPDLSFDVLSNCSGTSYTFAYGGSGATDLEWTIGDLSNPLATGTGDQISFTFPAEGTYPVTLKGTGDCTDSITRQIEIMPASLQTDFDYEYEACTSDSLSVRLLDLSDPGPDSIVAWNWTLADGRTVSGQNPLVNFGESDTLDLKLVITTIGGCTDSITKNIAVTLIEDVIAAIQDSVILCDGAANGLDRVNDPRYSYTWLPTSGVDNPSSPDPIFSEAGTYTVNVFIPGSATCSETKQVEVVAPPAINLSLDGPTESCETSEALTANVSADVDFTWLVNGTEVSENSNVLVADLFGNNTYTVIATDAFGCADTATTTLNLEGVDVEIPEQVAVCEGETININVNNLDSQDQLTYVWSPANLIASGQGTANVTINGSIGIQEVFVQIGNQHGCTINDTVEVVVVDDDIQLGFEVNPFCNGAIATFNNTSENAFGYVWDFGDPNNPNASSTEENPSYNYMMPGTYTATLTIQYDVSCTDTVSQTFEIKDTTRFNVDFEVDLIECLPGEATFRFTSLSTSADTNLTYRYEFSDGTIVNEANFDRTITEFGTQTVTFFVTTDDGCEGSISKDFAFPVVEVNLPDTLISCDESGITLNPGGRTEYIYQWAAADGISDLNAASPLVTPTVTTTYSVTITANGFSACVVTDEVVVVVPDMPLQMDQPDEVISCGEDVTLMTNIPGAVSYQWLDEDGNLLSPTNQITVNPFRDTTIVLVAEDQFGCTYLDTVRVIDNGVDAEVEPGTNLDLCEGQIFELGVRNLDDQDTLSYLWISDSLMISSETTATPMLNVDRAGQFTVQGIISNQNGCSDTLEVVINSGDLKIDLPDTVLICQDGPIELAPDADPSLNYTWSPSDGLSATNVANPTFTGDMDMTYFVMVNDPSVGPTCQVMDTVTVIVGGEVTITKNEHRQRCMSTSNPRVHVQS
ncbi:MAG: PKD domain-containing protein [Bacteroidota bacterium]